MENPGPHLLLHVRKDGILVLHQDGAPTDQTFATLAEAFTFLRTESAKADSRLTVFGFDGRKLMETTI